MTTTRAPATTTQVSSSPAPRPRQEDRRVNLAVTTNTASNQDLDKRMKGKKTKQKQKKKPLNERKTQDERQELGLERDKAGRVGCLSICDTLILEVYQLLGGNLCSC